MQSPNHENFKCALITIHLNGLKNVELINAGLGERQYSMPMVVKDSNGRSLGGGSRMLLKVNEEGFLGTETVQVVAADEVIPSDRKVSIIQLDVEGFEEQALSGAVAIIQRCLPIIILERIPEGIWLDEKILQLGYRMVQKIHGNNILMPETASKC